MATRRLIVAVAAAVAAGCATTPPPPPAPVPAPAPAPAPELVREPVTCPACEDHAAELARLRQELAQRDAELRELRSTQREQVKSLQETTREAVRAKVKLRRVATQADAASYLAEVEVTLRSLRQAVRGGPERDLLDLAQRIHAKSAAPFAQGDYVAAMDRAAQAEQLASVVAEERARQAAPGRPAGEAPFQTAVALRLTEASDVRPQPNVRARAIRVLPAGTEVTAHAVKGAWLRVETAEGRAGWIDQARVAPR